MRPATPGLPQLGHSEGFALAEEILALLDRRAKSTNHAAAALHYAITLISERKVAEKQEYPTSLLLLENHAISLVTRIFVFQKDGSG